MRLDKYLSQNTDLTRSQARKAIRRGEVRVNGETPTDVSAHIEAESQIFWRDTPLSQRGPRYFMLNKPSGYVCSTDEPGHPLAVDLLGDDGDGLHYAGRLDGDTTGLVLLTDDGQWSHRITSPRGDCRKRYIVTTRDEILTEDVAAFAEGLWLHGESRITMSAELTILSAHRAELWLSEGRYHQVKRMFAARGNQVTQLHRAQVGTLVLDEQVLPAGQYRALSTQERDSIA